VIKNQVKAVLPNTTHLPTVASCARFVFSLHVQNNFSWTPKLCGHYHRMPHGPAHARGFNRITQKGARDHVTTSQAREASGKKGCCDCLR